jgi:hypothetical protein
VIGCANQKATLIGFFAKTNINHGSDLAKMLDVLDEKLKLDLIKWFIKRELSEYSVLYQESQEVNRRPSRSNAWLSRNLYIERTHGLTKWTADMAGSSGICPNSKKSTTRYSRRDGT